jgi:hypothetical protein
MMAVGALVVLFSYLVYGIGLCDGAQKLTIVARVQRVEVADRPGRRRRQRLRLQMGSRVLEEAIAPSRFTTDIVRTRRKASCDVVGFPQLGRSWGV